MNELIPDELVVIHCALVAAMVPHAFGGAIALAYWGTPRYTHDIDLNIALPAEEHPRVLDALATVFPLTDRQKAERDITQIAQTRLRWGDLPVDLFFANTPFHDALAARTREVTYMTGIMIPVISAEDLILCKAFFNRPKDWLDIENMFQVQNGALDASYLRRWLSEYCLPPDDLPLRRIEGFLRQYSSPAGMERG